MHIRKSLITGILAGLLAGSVAAAHAVTVVNIGVADAATNNWLAGITAGGATSTFDPGLNFIFDDTFNVPPASVVTFGHAQQTGTSGTFSGEKAYFDVFANINAPAIAAGVLQPGAHDIEVRGTISGSVDSVSSSLTWTATDFFDKTTSIDYIAVGPDPISTVIPHIFGNLTIGTDAFALYVKRDQNLGKIGESPNSIEGVVNTRTNTVPEPGSLALLLGSGVAASSLFLRRRRPV